MKNQMFSNFNLIRRLKESKNLLIGIVLSVSSFSSPQLFGQTCVAPVVPPTTICAGNLAQLTPTNSNPAGTTYEWYSAQTGGTPLFTGNIYTPQLSSNTTFYVASKKTGTICPTTRTAVTVTVNPAPSNTLELPTTACVGDEINISFSRDNQTDSYWLSKPGITPRVPSGYGHQWGYIEFYTAVSSGTFSYLFKTPQGCTKTVTGYLTVAPALATPTMTAVTSVCQGVSLPLSPSMAGGTWTISPATGASITNNAFTGTTAGVYVVTYTVSNAGCSKSVTRSITVNALPVGNLTLDKSVVCAGDKVTANVNFGTNTQVLTRPTGVTNTGGAGFQGGYATWSNVSQSGTYVLTLTSLAGCVQTISRSLTVNPLPVPTITVAKTGICKDETLPLGGSTNVGTGVWSISTTPLPALSGGATTNSTINSSGLFTGNNPGIFNTRYTATQTLNGITCSAFTEKEITVGALPFTITGPANVCQNSQYTYTPQQIQAGGAGNSLYKWDVYQTGTVSPPISVYQAGMTGYNAVTGSAILDVKSESPKKITLTAEGRFYCIAGNTSVYRNQSASIDVTIVPNPTGIRLKCADATCNTLTAVMKDGSSTTGLTFSWTSAAGQVLGTTSTITNPKTYWGVNCTVTNSTGCASTISWNASFTYDACGRQVYDHTKAYYCQQGFDPNSRIGCASDANYRKGESENVITNQFNVYPNPANDKISFVTDGSNGSAVIYDIDGIALKTQTLTEGRTIYDIDITEIPSGVYFLHVTSSNGTVKATPVVKQ